MKEKALISACLLGIDCKYNGGNNRLPEEKLGRLRESHELIPVCPECCGGLTTPRTPSERLGDRVVSKSGEDVTAQFCEGARAALRIAGFYGAKLAILKANSPSCGSGTVYDGTFTGTLVPGDGVTAEMLKAHGIKVIDENAL